MEETGAIANDIKLLVADSVVVEWTHHDKTESMHHIGIIYEVNIIDGNIKEDADGLDSLGAIWYNISDLTRDKLSPLTYNALVLKGYNI